MDFNWLKTVIMGSGDPMHPSIAHTVFVLAAVIASGIALSRIKIKGISLGMTWILFTGIAFGHFLDSGTIHHDTLHFIKEFGLILFVFFIGLQVGPGFFSSLKSGGLKLIGLASLVIFLGVGTAYAIHLITGEPLPTMVGVLSGAVTNTPGLGAAQQAYADSGMSDPTIANSISLGYAVAYPLGVVGIITTMIIMRYVLRVDFKKEDEGLAAMSNETNLPHRYSVESTVSLLCRVLCTSLARLLWPTVTRCLTSATACVSSAQRRIVMLSLHSSVSLSRCRSRSGVLRLCSLHLLYHAVSLSHARMLTVRPSQICASVLATVSTSHEFTVLV